MQGRGDGSFNQNKGPQSATVQSPPPQDIPVNSSTQPQISSTVSHSNRGSSGDNVEKSGDTRLVSAMSRMSMETTKCINDGFIKHG